MLVDHLHDGHGTHQEEQRSAGVAQMVLDDIGDKREHRIGRAAEFRVLKLEDIHKLRVDQLDEVAGVNHVERPHHDKHKQGYGGLVDFSHAFEGYKQVADDENDDNGN